MKKKKSKKESVLLERCPERMIRAYCIAFAVSCVLTFVTMLFTHGESFANTFFSDPYTAYGTFGHDDFMDFFNSIRDASTKEVYKNGIIYPPLANMFFYMLSQMVKPELLDLPFILRKQLLNDTTCLALYAVFVFVCVFFCVKMMRTRLSGAVSQRFAAGFPLLLIFSYPLLYCIQRGNILLLAMVLTMFFVLYRNDERRWVRELSYLALAVAAGIKIYPAIFGLLLLTDKKFKEALRLVLYGFLFMIVPFFFYDGFESMRDLIENLKEFSAQSAAQVDYNFVTSDMVARVFAEKIGFDYLPTKSFLFSANMIAALLMYFILREEWQRVLCLSYLFMNLGSGGRVYILIFLLIPFTLFLQKGSFRRRDIAYFVFFSLLLLYLPCVYYPLFNTPEKIEEAGHKLWDKPNNLIAAITLHVMMLYMFIDMLKRISADELLTLKKKKKKQDQAAS